MARLGIVGFPNVGKTTLFNALTGLEAPVAPHPYSTAEPNVGVGIVPDAGLDAAAGVEGSKKTTHAGLELLDVAVDPGSGKTGLSTKLLGRLREMEALAVVLRAFEDESVVSEEAGTDPVAQAESFLLELALADAEIFSRKRDRVTKEAMSVAAKKREADTLSRAAALLEDGIHLRTETWSEEELGHFADLAPLTLKPAVWVVNVGEDAQDADSLAEAVQALVPETDTVVSMSARLEAEAAQLDPADRAELFEGLGLGEGALAKMVRAAYDALGLISFYTVGPKESRAWTVRRGSNARQSAGKIHSDLERGFIRAEVARLPDVIDAGGWDAAKAAGKVRLEGKEYIVAEGDVLVIRFSV